MKGICCPICGRRILFNVENFCELATEDAPEPTSKCEHFTGIGIANGMQIPIFFSNVKDIDEPGDEIDILIRC
jgi:hypothetical protein